MNWYNLLKFADKRNLLLQQGYKEKIVNWAVKHKFAEVDEENLGMMRNFNGLSVNVENPAGTERVGVNDKGEEWRTKMEYDYGFISSAKGEGGEGLDVYLGPDEESKKVYVVHQNDPESGEYDEDKVMLGFASKDQAKRIYLNHYDSDDYFGSITTIDFSEFEDIVNSPGEGKVTWKKNK